MKEDRSTEDYYESALTRFQRVMGLVQADTAAAKKHREELFGTASEYIYPDLYNMIGSGKDLVGSYPEFKRMLDDPKQVRLVAKMIAQHRLSNIVEILHRHEGIVRRNLEKQEKKPPPKKGKR